MVAIMICQMISTQLLLGKGEIIFSKGAPLLLMKEKDQIKLYGKMIYKLFGKFLVTSMLLQVGEIIYRFI